MTWLVEGVPAAVEGDGEESEEGPAGHELSRRLASAAVAAAVVAALEVEVEGGCGAAAVTAAGWGSS